MIAKYPRTFHLTFSPGKGSNDKVLKNNNAFIDAEVIITSKLDGSNFCLTNKECFARSHNGPPTHKSFDFGKAVHNQIKHFISENLAIYAEYTFAKHAIEYTALKDYVNIFNVFDIKRNVWLSWDNVARVARDLNLETVPVLFHGVIVSERDLHSLCNSLMKEKEFGVDEREGVVIRLANEFSDFSSSVAKLVRKGHVQAGDSHLAHKEIVKNKLRVF